MWNLILQSHERKIGVTMWVREGLAAAKVTLASGMGLPAFCIVQTPLGPLQQIGGTICGSPYVAY